MSVVIDGTTGITVPAGASQAQAETGTDNTVLMTPLRTAQAISALSTSPALEFISSAAINNVATVDFTGFDSSKYSDYVFSLNNVIPVTDSVDLLLRFSTDGGASFSGTYFYCTIYGSPGTAVSAVGSSAGAAQILAFTGVGSDTNEFGVSGEVRVFGPDLTAFTAFTGLIHAWGANSKPFISPFAGQNSTTTAVDAVRFYFSSGNLESGRITMYGVRKS